MGNAGRVNRAGLALTSTCLLVGSILWLALPARAAVTISITPSSGPPGTSVTLAGSGFGANEVVALCWGNLRCANSGQPVTNASGQFSRSFSVPINPEDYLPGVNTVGACGRSSGECTQTVFNVIGPPTTITATTPVPETTTSTTIADAPTTTGATTTTAARTTTTRQSPTTTGATTTTSFGSPTPTQPDQSDPALPNPTSTPQQVLAPTLTPFVPGSEVFSLFSTLSEPAEPTDERDAVIPLTPARDETAPLVAASDGDEDGRGLDKTEAILLWLATMSLFTCGMIAYEFWKR